MKIGLEFEGVIRNYSTGVITRWPKIPKEIRTQIKKMMFPGRKKIEPVDGYDCLAEVRTEPISNPTPFQLLEALFTEMENATNAFMTHGYYIQWFEQEIPKELHDEIKHDCFLRNPDGKKSKYTQTFKDGQVVEYRSEGNLYRGGGLHINISSIPQLFAPALVMFLDRELRPYTGLYKFQSSYRKNILFRTRNDCTNHIINSPEDHYKFVDYIVEYMSHGFNIPKIEGWKEIWNECENNHGFFYPFNYHLYWAICLIRSLNLFVDSTKQIR